MNLHLFPFLRSLALLNIAILSGHQGFGQYYYHDIVLTAQNRQQQQLYKKNSVTGVKLLSYEASGQPSEDFICNITPNNSYTQTKTFTQSALTGTSSSTAFYNFRGQLYRSVDSSKESVNKYEYSYDSTGRLLVASNVSEGFTSKIQQKETHEWKYGSKCPEKMFRIKNSTDTTAVQFVCDEQGNVTEEESRRNNISTDKIYYYYDSLHRLTDVVRYNNRLGKLLPDYIFEYNDKGQLVQMITVQGGTDYLIWKYEYAEDGLKKRELCFNKQKSLVGKIEYQYSFKNR
jgi:YD repeat-containing protein